MTNYTAVNNRFLTDIIILKYNAPEVEKACVKSVLENTTTPYHLTIYDNYVEKNNISTIWNKLITQSSAPYICLLNSDTEVSYGWLGKLVETFFSINEVGCVGPSTNNSHNYQSKTKPDKIFVDYGLAYPHNCLSGFCLVFPKKVFEEVGGFPDNFGFYGQEVSFIDKIMYLGYKQIWRTDVDILHHGEVSAKIAQENGDIDIKKEREIGRFKYQEFRKELYEG